MLTPEERSLLEKEDQYGFEELFYRALESWFSSDIACCDECYDDFLEYWPHAYSADNAAFQCSSIDMGSFYSGSRIREFYTEEEFFRLLKMVPCPRCGSELKYNIWPYTLPFDVVNGFESKILEIYNISQSTPFLLLKHQFAQDVYEAISNLSSRTEASLLEESLFRARLSSSLSNTDIAEFDFPPNKVVSEGRYNHAGMPVLYLASSPETCFHEMREVSCHLAEIRIREEVKILDLINSYEAHEEYSDLLKTLVYSALISAKQDSTGWHKPKYIFSRFVADCAKSAEFDAIKYPSTRIGNDCFNLVVINEKFSLKNSSQLIRIFQYEPPVRLSK